MNDIDTFGVEKLYSQMETDLLMKIASKIADGKPMEIDKFDLETNSKIIGSGGVNEWQLERLKELGGLTKENAELIAEYSDKTVEEIMKIFQKAEGIGSEIDKDILESGVKAGILNEVNPTYEEAVVKNILDKGVKETLTTLNKVNNSMLVSSGEAYRNTVNSIYTSVLSGTKTINQAMQESVSQLAKNGLTAFTSKSGAEWNSESYVKMVMRTNTNNIINNITEERYKLYGDNYIEIDQHTGARELCAEDQGQIFSLNDDTTPIRDLNGREIKVRAWSSSSYGEPAGILGINCRHSRHAFVPNVSIFRNEKINDTENKQRYQLEQTQRSYERTIRNKKREINMLQTIGADDDYINKKKNSLKSLGAAYNKFCYKNDLYRNTSNEWVSKGSITNKQKEQIQKDYKQYKSA